jgi:integrase
MPRIRLNDDKIVRHTRADGSVAEYRYDRVSGRRVTDGDSRRPSPPVTALAVRGDTAASEITLGELVRAWRYSSHFDGLTESTRRNYNAVMRHPAVVPLLAVPCSAITPRLLRGLRDGVAEVGRDAGRARRPMANLILAVLGTVFSWGMEHEDLEANPVATVKRLRVEGGGHLPWSDETVAAWLDRGPEWARRVVQLGLWTALRASDLVALRWEAWDGTALHVTPAKTRRSSGVTLYLPLSPAANAMLRDWRADRTVGLTILTQRDGRPFGNSNNLATQLKRLQRGAGLPPGTTHGLRVTAATRLIEAGVPSRDVMALTGHTQEGTFAKYVRQADQRQRAVRAAAAWATVTPLRGAG